MPAAAAHGRSRSVASNRDGFSNRVNFDILTSGSMHAEWLLWSIRVQSLVSIVQAGFLFECGQTDRRDWTLYPRRQLYSWHG